jgi:hypothetical protein
MTNLAAQYAAIQPPPLPGETVWLWRKPCEDVAAQAADLAERYDVVVHTLPWQSPCDSTLDAHEAAGIMAQTDCALGLVADLLCRLGYPRTAKALGEVGK